MYWQVGHRLRHDILGAKRAGYGERIIRTVADELTSDYGQGFSEKNLRHMIRFVERFPDREIVSVLSRQLSWTHFRVLIYIDDPLKREFYAEMCRVERWGTRVLEKKILRELEAFILEIGTDFAFVARQKRITIDDEDYYIDLLFYHRGLRRLVVVELKLDKFRAADKGQMELYLRWLDKHERRPGEEAPLGLILCADKSDEHVALLQLDRSGIRVAAYLTELPPKKLLKRKLHESARRARAQLEGRGSEP